MTSPPHSFLHRFTRWLLYHEIRIVCRTGLTALGGVRAAGEERVPRRGGLIVAANHLSLADPVVLQTYVPRFLNYLMTDKFYYVPVLHQFVRFWGVLVVKQEGSNKETLRAAEEVLARGGAVGIFPEGGLPRGGAAREVQSGVALLARRARVPILPVGLAGTERLLPPGALCLHRAPLAVYIGEPIPPGREDRDTFAAAVAQAIRSCAARARELLKQPKTGARS